MHRIFWLGDNIWLKLKVAGSSAYLGVGRGDGVEAHLARSDDFQ